MAVWKVRAMRMRGLTLWQPWAWAVGCGLKRVENRSWPPPASMLGQTIAIHAGKRWDAASAERLADGLVDMFDGSEELPSMPSRETAVFGAVIATARIADVVRSDRDVAADQRRWFFGPYGWLLDSVVPVVDPVSCRGYQGLWALPHDVERDVRACLRNGL